MAVFFISRQHHSFLLYSIVAPNTIPMLAQFYPCECINGLSESCTDQSSSVADCVFGNGVQQVVKKGVISTTMDKKRKSRGGVSSTNNDQIRGGREVKCKKQRRRRNLMEENEGNKAKSDYKKDLEEAPTGFIHVRARRGQATDSHSLAERVRREKISERMKVLKALVPGCDKVTGKALMLDEIINYVQSLQHQVEFLSMKIDSLNPTLYDFGMDLDAPMISPESLNKLLPSTLLSNVEKYNSALPMTFFDAIPASINPHLP